MSEKKTVTALPKEFPDYEDNSVIQWALLARALGGKGRVSQKFWIKKLAELALMQVLPMPSFDEMTGAELSRFATELTDVLGFSIPISDLAFSPADKLHFQKK